MADEYLFWVPRPQVHLWGSFGLAMYEMMTWVALLGGITIWLLQIRKMPVNHLQRFLSLVIIAAICIPTTRIFHILFWTLDEYFKHPRMLTRLVIGHSIHGVIFGFILSAVFIAKMFKVPIHEIGDRLSFWPPFGLIFVRIGNFWNSEIIGTKTDVSWAVLFFYTPDHGKIPRHPVQLYESGFAALLLIAMVVVFLMNRRKTPWLLSSMVLIGYSVGRFVFDYFKEEPGWLFGPWLTTGQVLSIPFFVLGIYLLFFSERRKRKDES